VEWFSASWFVTLFLDADAMPVPLLAGLWDRFLLLRSWAAPLQVR
jgi:hypothetical protein